jgi:hypothetical protein
VTSLYEEARVHSMNRLSRSLEKMWIKCYTNVSNNTVPYYWQKGTKLTQWTPPYRLHYFAMNDLEEADFIEIMMCFRIFADRFYNYLLNII